MQITWKGERKGHVEGERGTSQGPTHESEEIKSRKANVVESLVEGSIPELWVSNLAR